MQQQTGAHHPLDVLRDRIQHARDMHADVQLIHAMERAHGRLRGAIVFLDEHSASTNKRVQTLLMATQTLPPHIRAELPLLHPTTNNTHHHAQQRTTYCCASDAYARLLHLFGHVKDGSDRDAYSRINDVIGFMNGQSEIHGCIEAHEAVRAIIAEYATTADLGEGETPRYVLDHLHPPCLMGCCFVMHRVR